MKKGSFGEIEFFTGEKRKFSAISKDFTTLLKIKRKNFLLLLSDVKHYYFIIKIYIIFFLVPSRLWKLLLYKRPTSS